MKRFLSFLLAAIFLMGFMVSGTSCVSLLLSSLAISELMEPEEFETIDSNTTNDNNQDVPDQGYGEPEDENNKPEEPPVMYPDENGNGIPDTEEDKNGNGIPDFQEPESPILADGSIFTLDGDLAEWEGTKTLQVIGVANENVANSENKKVTFYGVLADDGLHLACDAYHDVYIAVSHTEWWTNSNFEFFIGSGMGQQKYVYAQGIDNQCRTSGADVQAVMKTEEINRATKYHTITEVFVPMEALREDDIYFNSIDVGVAWKTTGDFIIGGAGKYGKYGEDEYWVPAGTWPSNGLKPIVTASGIYSPDEYIPEYY